MKPSLLFTLASVYLGFVGLGLLFAPDDMTFGALGVGAPAILVSTVRGW